jgi:hypothetical protein
MTTIIRLFAMLLITSSATQAAEPVAKQFLRYIYGGDGIEISNVCHPSDDLWMLRGAKNTNALAALNVLNITAKPAGVTSGLLGTDIYFIETRDGKVDPAFNLDGTYVIHRQVILHFIYSALSGNRGMLGRLVTDVSKVKIDGSKAASGDMDQYGSIIELLPVVRASKPADDAKSRTVTYRVPIGEEVLTLTLLRDGNTWKIDTSKTVRVPLEFFFRER